jgi:hypothetical protein
MEIDLKVAAYTSCSANYLPKARVLAETLKAFHQDAVLVLLLCDDIPAIVDFSKENFDHVLQPKDLGYNRAWTFEHNVMELCTAVKGRGLMKLMELVPTADLYLYLDPDVAVYSSLEPVLEYMGDNEIGLVPHITAPEEFDVGVNLTELSVLRHGTYNLGHLILRPGAHAAAMAAWWADRLDRYCFDDPEYGLFTDQRWCDLVPSIFEKVTILRQPNLDVASWNVGSRELTWNEGTDNGYSIDGFPLITYHFSGTGPTGAHRRVRESLSPTVGAQAEIERNYEEAIERNSQSILARWPFQGDFFDDGTPISNQARRFYRRNRDLKEAFPDPFLVADSCYLHWLQANRSDITSTVRISPDHLSKAFNDLFDENYYLQRYPDAYLAVESGRYASALEHYIGYGSSHMYDPSHYFITLHYAERARELGGFIQDPQSPTSTWLWHYLEIGLPSGIEPLPDFDSVFYLKANPGLRESWTQGIFSSPLAHFVNFGDLERRSPSQNFNPEAYMNANPMTLLTPVFGCQYGPYGSYLATAALAGRVTSHRLIHG